MSYVLALYTNSKLVGYFKSDDEDVVANPNDALIFIDRQKAQLCADTANTNWDFEAKGTNCFEVVLLSDAKVVEERHCCNCENCSCTPNVETVAAMDELESGAGVAFETVGELLDDLTSGSDITDSVFSAVDDLF
jgi:hypothetical protein